MKKSKQLKFFFFQFHFNPSQLEAKGVSQKNQPETVAQGYLLLAEAHPVATLQVQVVVN